MANNKNILDFTPNLLELERRIEMGYIDPTVAFCINKFSRFSLANNTLSLASPFNNPDPFLDTPAELYLSSSDALDDSAFSVKIYYVSQTDRSLQDVTVALNGQTAVSLGTDIYCVWRMENAGAANFNGIISVGSEAVPVGGVPAAANTYCNILLTIGGIEPVNQSLTSVFSIPRGWTAFYVKADVSADKGADINAASTLRLPGETFKYRQTLSIFQNSKVLDLFQRIPSETDIKILAYAQTGGNCSVRFRLLIINNDYVDRFINQGV